MMPFRPPVELIFALQGIGVVAVILALLILWVRSAKKEALKRETEWCGTDNPKVYGALREGSVVVLERPIIKPGQLHGVELEVQRIKWVEGNKGATIFVGKHRTKTFDSAILSPPTENPSPIKVLINPPIPEEPKDEEPPL
jgi:hypothetical protein